MALLECFEPFAKLPEARVVQTFSKPSRHLDLDLCRLLARVWRAKHRFKEVGIEHECVEIVADGIHVHVLVNQFDRLRSERVPQKTTSAGRRPHRLIDMREPTVIGLLSSQNRIG